MTFLLPKKLSNTTVVATLAECRYGKTAQTPLLTRIKMKTINLLPHKTWIHCLKKKNIKSRRIPRKETNNTSRHPLIRQPSNLGLLGEQNDYMNGTRSEKNIMEKTRGLWRALNQD